MRLICSNRTETLLQELAQVVAQPLNNPVAQECILVPNQAQSDWLGMRLAEAQGAWTGLDFPFPKAAILQWINLAFPQEAKSLYRFEPHNLFWAVLAELEDHPSDPAFARFQAFRGHLPSLWQTVWQIAQTLERYQIYRPDWLQDWEQGKWDQLSPDDQWQGRLWQGLTRRLGTGHFGRLALALIKRLKRATCLACRRGSALLG